MRINSILFFIILGFNSSVFSQGVNGNSETEIIDKGIFKKYIDRFNQRDKETVKSHIENKDSWTWLKDNIPFFECPDHEMEEIYYFRWWVYRKHIISTPSGYVISEFLPNVAHAKKYNTIVCASGLHIEEGRWIRDPKYIKSYSNFWYSAEADRSGYSNWLVPAIWEFCKTTGDTDFAISLLPHFLKDYKNWETQNRHNSGLFWSNESNDGGEYSISGNGLRPTLNSYMYGTAKTIAEIAFHASSLSIFQEYNQKAAEIKHVVEEKLWDKKDQFFKSIHLQRKIYEVSNWDFDLVPDSFNVRELYGYIPWKFSLPGSHFNKAWDQIKDKKGFNAPFGLTTAEQRHFRFMKYRVKRCQWDGAVWPFASCLALKAMANFITDYTQNIVSKTDYLRLLQTYANAQYRTSSYGERIPWIDENIHPYSGIWLARSIIFELGDPVVGNDLNKGFDRGKDYNHSSYADLIISDLIGLKSRADNMIEIDPVITDDYWSWFCLENVVYHGKKLTILYDKNGKKYSRGKGLLVYIDGKLAMHSSRIKKLIFAIK